MKLVNKIKQRQQPFEITSVCRDDLEEIGFDTKNVDDATMLKLSYKMADVYCENGFWVDLEIIADDLKIKKHRESKSKK